MIEIQPNEYHHIKTIIDHMNKTLFIFVHAVLDGIQPGKILVNDYDHPTAGLVISRGGKYYLFGDEGDTTFNQALLDFLEEPNNHAHFYDLYASSERWLSLVKTRLNENVVDLQRTIYLWNDAATAPEDLSIQTISYEIRSVDEQLFDMYVKEVDKSYSLLWGSASEYVNQAFGYCVTNDSGIVSACNTFYMGGGYIEPDIITLPDYRRQGLAYALCQQFMKKSRERDIVPYWDCDSGNVNSNQLALKLGLKKAHEVPILWWHENKEVIARYLKKYNYSS